MIFFCKTFFFDDKISISFFEIRKFWDLVIFYWFSIRKPIENQAKSPNLKNFGFQKMKSRFCHRKKKLCKKKVFFIIILHSQSLKVSLRNSHTPQQMQGLRAKTHGFWRKSRFSTEGVIWVRLFRYRTF